MKMVTFKKVICGVSLGTVMALGSMSSAFAADINHPTAQDKTVVSKQPQQAKQFTQEQVKADALKKYKGTVKDIKLNKENGKDVYVIVIHGDDGNDHWVKEDAATGVTVNFTQEQIKEIALQQYAGIVKSITLSQENGIDFYVVVIHGQNGIDQTVKVNAITGAIVNYNYYDAQRNNYYNHQNGNQNGSNNDAQKGQNGKPYANNDQNGKNNANNDQNGKTNVNNNQNGKTNVNNNQNGKTNVNNDQNGKNNANNDQNGKTKNDQNGNANNTQKGTTNTDNAQNGNNNKAKQS
jgi:uncharacterized membrane protein YkoI